MDNTELNRWLKYLEFIEPPNSQPLTAYQKEDIEFTKKKIAELRSEINGKKRGKEKRGS